MLAGTRHVENLLPHRIIICGREMSGLCLFKKRYVHLTHQSPNSWMITVFRDTRGTELLYSACNTVSYLVTDMRRGKGSAQRMAADSTNYNTLRLESM